MVPNWLPIRCDLHVDPAVIAIANATGTDEFCVVGRLVRLWSWANEQLPNGNADGVTCSWVDRYLYCPGFAEAMVSTGWLLKTDKGVEFPKFEVWNSQGAKIRKVTARRVGRHRAGRNAGSNADTVTPVTPTQLPRERERVESSNTPLPPTGDGDVAPKKPRKPRQPHAEHPHFAAFWEAYPRKTAKPNAVKAFAKIDPDEMTLAAMLKAIDWQRRSESWCKDGGQYIPHPATWLNAARWEDQIPNIGGTSSPTVSINGTTPAPIPPPLPNLHDYGPNPRHAAKVEALVAKAKADAAAKQQEANHETGN